MANLNYRSQFHYSFAGEPVSLYLSVSFGASGAPTIVANTGMGIASVARASAGVYNITLTNSFASLLMVKNVFNTSGTAAAPASPGMYVSSNAVSTLSAPILQITFNAAGTATDPASGEIAILELVLNRSSQRV